jgi:hypothetical protein
MTTMENNPEGVILNRPFTVFNSIFGDWAWSILHFSPENSKLFLLLSHPQIPQ